MAKKRADETRRQKKLAQQQSKRKQRAKAGGAPMKVAAPRGGYLSTGIPSSVAERVLTDLPLHSCWVMGDVEPGGIASITVVRRTPDGLLVAGGYLLDLLGFGLKDGWANLFHNEADLTSKLDPARPMEYAEARLLILASVEWARRWGFRLPREWPVLEKLIEPLEPGEELPLDYFGRDGKPMLVGEMEDLARRVILPRPAVALEAAAGDEDEETPAARGSG